MVEIKPFKGTRPYNEDAKNLIAPSTDHLSHLYELGLMRAKAYGQKDCFEAGLTFANQEGIIPAPEGNHAIKGAIKFLASSLKGRVPLKGFISTIIKEHL